MRLRQNVQQVFSQLQNAHYLQGPRLGWSFLQEHHTCGPRQPCDSSPVHRCAGRGRGSNQDHAFEQKLAARHQHGG
jgi:hypothetical protein